MKAHSYTPSQSATPKQVTDPRHIVVVDVETTGFDPSRNLCVEVAWWDLTADARGYFIPRHNVSDALAGAQLEALRLNRYIDRIAGQPQDQDGSEARRLADALNGHTLAGSNPAFDASFLRQLFVDYENRELCYFAQWHHRMWDLSPYSAGVLGLDHLPGLAEVCERLDIWARPDHSAESDVTATGLCFQALFDRAGVKDGLK